jgi:hypothetical protein
MLFFFLLFSILPLQLFFVPIAKEKTSVMITKNSQGILPADQDIKKPPVTDGKIKKRVLP